MKGKVEYRVTVSVKAGITHRSKHGKVWEAFESDRLSATTACMSRQKAERLYVTTAKAAGFKHLR